MSGKNSLRSGITRVAAVLSATALLAVGCSDSDSTRTSEAAGSVDDPKVITFDNLVEGTVRITGQGTFIEPGQVTPFEGGWHGSGFIIDPSGIAITNNHVVVGAGRLNGSYGESASEHAGIRVLGASECLDLAVIQLDAQDLPHFEWYEGNITTGLDVYSAGFPLGAAEDFTLTRGIVSKADFKFDTQWASLEHVIEHDARIRGGNSGGPLITPDAKVLGVNYAGDDAFDYNFAIHRDVVLEVVDELREGQRISSLGINASAWISGDPNFHGVWVSSVEAGGPADRAGVQPGDLLLKLAGVSVGDDGTLASYCEVLDTHGSDGTMDFQILRPSTNSLMSGQINGRELAVTQTNVLASPADPTDGVIGDAGNYSGQHAEITDDSRSFAVSVPVEWTDTDGRPWADTEGRNWTSLAAAPDIADFNTTFTAPGLWMLGTGPDYSAAEALEQFDFSGSCTVTASDTWDDGFYRGPYNEYDCGDGTLIVLATQDYESTGTLVLVVQLASEYELNTVLAEILNTFRFI